MNLRVAPVFYHISPSAYNHFPREPGIWLRAARFAIRPLQPSTFIHLASPHNLTGAFLTPPRRSLELPQKHLLHCTGLPFPHRFFTMITYYHTGLLVLFNQFLDILPPHHTSHYNVYSGIITIRVIVLLLPHRCSTRHAYVFCQESTRRVDSAGSGGDRDSSI